MTPEQTDELLTIADDMIRAEVKPRELPPDRALAQAQYNAIALESERETHAA